MRNLQDGKNDNPLFRKSTERCEYCDVLAVLGTKVCAVHMKLIAYQCVIESMEKYDFAE